ncbi:MAG TPA: Pvc16 family protein [Solirubrobacteraceae bacterium]|jgi:hypothetical protein|nr:Pvc16 family protein [Solirubrobacteraceae bacterium]
MALITTVAPNTALADLDEALEFLLRRELASTGFEGVAIAFDAPDREWSKALTQPTLNLFLYDLRENRQRRAAAWDGATEDGRRIETRPPLWLDASYTLTAFSRAVQDEHRLLSQALTALSSYPDLSGNVLGDSPFASVCQQFGPLHTRVGHPGHDATPDFWTAVGGPYKLSFHYIVTVPFPSGAVLHRGPPVRVQHLGVGDRLTRRPDLEERSRVAGTAVEADGSPVADVWVTLRDLGRVCETDRLGHFSFIGVPPGSHPVLARDRSGRETEATLEVPGELFVITMPPPAR